MKGGKSTRTAWKQTSINIHNATSNVIDLNLDNVIHQKLSIITATVLLLNIGIIILDATLAQRRLERFPLILSLPRNRSTAFGILDTKQSACRANKRNLATALWTFGGSDIRILETLVARNTFRLFANKDNSEKFALVVKDKLTGFLTAHFDCAFNFHFDFLSFCLLPFVSLVFPQTITTHFQIALKNIF
jgi:hypothetical protein